MVELVIAPARNLSGAVRPPGDKSISHRCALLAAIADGTSTLENYSTGADCQSSLGCVEALGIEVTRADRKITIGGRGLHGLRSPERELDAGNSGSTIRMFSGVLAAQPFASQIGGDASLSRRPMRRICEPLRAMGAEIAAADGDRPPLRFQPRHSSLHPIDYPMPVPGGLVHVHQWVPASLHAIDYAMPVASAQVKSAILFAALYAEGTTRVAEPLPTRDHSEILLRHMGVTPRRQLRPRAQLELDGPAARLTPLENFRIPGDPSSAAFFLCAAAAFPEADLLVEDVSLNPTRSALLDVLARLGAKAEVVSIEDRAGELAGSLHIASQGKPLAGTVIEGAEAVALIDEIPILAVLATATRGGIEFKDVGELRVKESDRIAAIAENLRAMGASCEERPTGLFVPGPQPLHGARIASHDDHRIAMAFAIAGLLASGDTCIDHADCAAISYPEFYSTLDRLAER